MYLYLSLSCHTFFRPLALHLLRASWLARAVLLLGVTVLSGCSTLDSSHAPTLERSASWVVLPFANHTETPLAGNRAEAIAQALLATHNVGPIRRAPTHQETEALFNSAAADALQSDALAWAREQKIRYALVGTVQEWRYKVGVDGEPAAGVMLQILDVSTGLPIWSGSGAQSGWSREALSAVAQKLIQKLLRTGLAGAR